jgi:hypothetical protein
VAAVWYRFRAELPKRWRAVLALALLAGVAGGIAVAAAAGASRSDTAFSRLLNKTNAWQVLVNPDDSNGTALRSPAIARLPMVSAAARVDAQALVPADARTEKDFGRFGIVLVSDRQTMYTLARPKILHGRVPDPDRADEVLVDPNLAKQEHVRVGSRIAAYSFTDADLARRQRLGLSFEKAAAAVGRGEFGTRLALNVVGIGVNPDNIVVDEGFETPAMTLSPAFAKRYPDVAKPYWGEIVRLRRGAADIPAFRAAIEKMAPGEAIAFQTTTVTEAKVARAVRPQVVALAVFALIVAVAGLLLVGQALARQSFLDSVDSPPLHALGFSRGQLFAGGMLRAVLVAVGGAVIATVAAVAASPLAPIGPARTAEPDPGVRVDALVLGIGALAIVVGLLALAAIPAWRFARAGASIDMARGARPSRLAGALARVGAPLPASAGVRMALEPGRGRTAVPSRTTIVTSALAIATVTAALVFAASLHHLVTTPRLYGWNWDVRMSVTGDDPAQIAKIRNQLGGILDASPRDVSAWSTASLSQLTVNRVSMPALGIRAGRTVGPTVVSGRLPQRGNEIALGALSMRTLGVSTGDSVNVTKADGSGRSMRIVGRVVLPGLGTYSGSDKTALGEGAVVARGALAALGANFGGEDFLVRFTPGASRAHVIDRARALASVAGGSQSVDVSNVQRPSDIVSYERVRTLPLLLAGVLAFLTTATVAHALVTAVRRRRRDLALLKTLGFSRGQTSRTVAWQATTVGAVALLCGVPLGIAGGRWGWQVLTDNLGTVSEPIVPRLALLLAIPLVILILNVVSFVPGRIAAHLRPATVLRSE